MSVINLIRVRVDELENIFNEKVLLERFFIRTTLITNLKIMAELDSANAELYILRIRELGYKGSLK